MAGILETTAREHGLESGGGWGVLSIGLHSGLRGAMPLRTLWAQHLRVTTPTMLTAR